MLFEYSVPPNTDVIPLTRAGRQFVCSSVLNDIMLMLTQDNYAGDALSFSDYCDVSNTKFFSAGTAAFRSSFLNKSINISKIEEAQLSTTDCQSSVVLVGDSLGTKKCYVYVRVAILSVNGPHFEFTVSLLPTSTVPTTLPVDRTVTFKFNNPTSTYSSTRNSLLFSLSADHLFIGCKNYVSKEDSASASTIFGAFSQSGCIICQYRIQNHWKTHSLVADKLNFVFVKLGFVVPTTTVPFAQALEVFDPDTRTVMGIDTNPGKNNFIWRNIVNLNVKAPVFTPDFVSDAHKNTSDWLMPLYLISDSSVELASLAHTRLLLAEGRVGYVGDVVLDELKNFYILYPINNFTSAPIMDSDESNTPAIPKILLPMY